MRVYLNKSFFAEKEALLAENGTFKVFSFKYSTGVEALKVENEKGYFIILPYQGQQIWRVNFLGRELTMKTNCEEPVPNVEYLQTYGGFLLHCGINNTGTAKDGEKPYPQHGEIPNAAYNMAYIDLTDEYVAVGGELRYDKSFVKNYTFSPEVRLYKGETVLKVTAELENRRNTPMDYMYLCHINFRPIDDAELVYTAKPEKVKIDKSGVSVSTPPDLRGYIEKLEGDITLHHKVGGPDQVYKPELCFIIDYLSDENGKGYTMQYTDNGACFVSHDTEAMPYVIRWISRTGDEDSMGMALPSTAEHLGLRNAQEKGQIKFVPPYGKVKFEIVAGWLEKNDADQMKTKIENIKKA